MSPEKIDYAAIDTPVFLWGAPGIGKTASIAAAARKANAKMITLIGSQIDPVDLGGQPYLTPDGPRVAPPSWVRAAEAALTGGTPVWIFFDELSSAPPTVRAAMLDVIQRRQVAGVDISGAKIIAAGNGGEHAADGGYIDAATANRFLHFSLGADPDVHLPGLLSGWGRPQTPTEAAARALIVDFLRARPNALLDAPTIGELGPTTAAWPSPRSWDALARTMGAGIDIAVAAPAAVGAATARELTAYVAARDLPSPEKIISGEAELPARGDRALATWESVIAYVLSVDDSKAVVAAEAATAVLADMRRGDLRLQLARAIVSTCDAASRAWPADLSSEVTHAKKIVK